MTRTVQPAAPTPDIAGRVLRVWLPVRFDPASTSAGALIRQRIDAFEATHPGLHVDVRVKDEVTLLNTLALTRAAAPEALPDLVALPRPDLETAALKGLLGAFEQPSGPAAPDWYAYARDAARVQNTIYGLPFMGDALVVIYSPLQSADPTRWESLRTDGSLAIPPGDPRALFALGLYQSLGGPIADTQGRPTLDETLLTKTLEFYAPGPGGSGPPPLQFASDEGLVEALKEGRIRIAVSWASQFLSAGPAGLRAAPLPGLSGTPYDLGTAWCWALAGADPDRQGLTIELANYLVAPVFLAVLTDTAGYLPTDRAALEAWPDHERQFFAAQVINAVHLLPSEEAMRSLGPVLTGAVAGVLSGASPQMASQAAVQQLK